MKILKTSSSPGAKADSPLASTEANAPKSSVVDDGGKVDFSSLLSKKRKRGAEAEANEGDTDGAAKSSDPDGTPAAEVATDASSPLKKQKRADSKN